MLTKVQDQINQLTQEKLDNNVKEIDLWISFFVYLTYNKVKGSVFNDRKFTNSYRYYNGW